MYAAFFKLFILIFLFKNWAHAETHRCELYLNSTNNFIRVPKDSNMTLKKVVGIESFNQDLFFVFTFNTVYVVYGGIRFHGGSALEFTCSTIKNTTELPLTGDTIIVQFFKEDLKPLTNEVFLTSLNKSKSKYFMTCAHGACQVGDIFMDKSFDTLWPYLLLDQFVVSSLSKNIYTYGNRSFDHFYELMKTENEQFKWNTYFKAYLLSMLPLYFMTLFN